MRLLRALLILAASFAAVPAHAQVIESSAPDSVSVTIYRDPDAGPGSEIDFEWLRGYALITETRTVTIPAGAATIRFEGVAGGILPESAIVTGWPDGVREKNLDADLLSPRTLYARSYGRPVTIRRELPGGIVEDRAVIRSGPDGAAILQTKDGFIAADCSGNDALVYDKVPDGLSAKPVLSVLVDNKAERRVTLTLSYLAWGFDWRANYVATMRPDGKSASLIAWVTLANSDVTSFADAEAQVVAGRLAREDQPDAYLQARNWGGDGPHFEFRCTGARAVPQAVAAPLPPPMPVMAMAPAPMAELMEGNEIIVTGSRVQLENLGDLKLYRIPHRTTVASNSQKQVALLDRPSVDVDVIYRAHTDGDDVEDVEQLLRTRNQKEKGLGIPLPAGSVAVFEPLGDARLLIGESAIRDKAVDEEVELEIGDATQVTAKVEDRDFGNRWDDHELVVTNANPWPIRFEADFDVGEDEKLSRTSARLGRKNGRDLWSVEVPANGTARLKYRLTEVKAD